MLAAIAIAAHPSAMDFMVFAHLEMLLFLWFPFVLLLYHGFAWAVGPEVAAAYSKPRRLNLLLTAVGASITAVMALFLVLSFVRGATDAWRFDPGNAIAWYMRVPGAADDFQMRVLTLALVEVPIALAVLMGTKLDLKCRNGRLSDAERQTGPAGLIAWLRGPNLVWAIAMTVMVSLATGLLQRTNGRFNEDAAVTAAVLTALAAFGLLLAYPVWQTLATPATDSPGGVAATPTMPRSAVGADLSSERQRVLRLLEDGRVTADEAAELLSALAATVSPTAADAGPMSRSRKLAMAGAFVVLIGFFLPWFRLNPLDEARKMFNLPMNSASAMPYVPNNTVWSEFAPRLQIAGTPVTAMSPMLEGSPIAVTGGDVGRGMGWLVLAGAFVTAAAPAIAGLSPSGQRNLAWLAIGVTSIVTLHLLISSFSWASYGLLFVLIGLGVQWASLLQELPRRAVARVPA